MDSDSDNRHAVAGGEPPDPAHRVWLAETIYRELRSLARRRIGRGGANASLGATDLVHEAYARLATAKTQWLDDVPFLVAAGKAMRSVLVDHARSRNRAKRRTSGKRVPLDELCERFEANSFDLLVLDEALTQLARMDPAMAHGVELRFFVGLDPKQTAKALGMSLRTFERQWAATRVWLYRRIT